MQLEIRALFDSLLPCLASWPLCFPIAKSIHRSGGGIIFRSKNKHLDHRVFALRDAAISFSNPWNLLASKHLNSSFTQCSQYYLVIKRQKKINEKVSQSLWVSFEFLLLLQAASKTSIYFLSFPISYCLVQFLLKQNLKPDHMEIKYSVNINVYSSRVIWWY